MFGKTKQLVTSLKEPANSLEMLIFQGNIELGRVGRGGGAHDNTGIFFPLSEILHKIHVQYHIKFFALA